MVSYAAMSVLSGTATTVACVFADAPLKPKQSAGSAYNRSAREWYGFGGMTAALGLRSVNSFYALAAQRHMARYGTTSEQLGAIAVATRDWASRNPLAQMRDPITIDDHQNSRWVSEPLHLLDCCLVSNGAIAVIVTSDDRARDLARPPAHLWGWARAPRAPQGARQRLRPDDRRRLLGRDRDEDGRDHRVRRGRVRAVRLLHLHGPGVAGGLRVLREGRGRRVRRVRRARAGGSLPTNTGGGQLSAYYMWGMTPLSEAVIQARGDGGERQAASNDVILVSGNGGILDHHSTLIVSPHQKGA